MLTFLVAANKLTLSTETATFESVLPVSELQYNLRPTFLHPVRIPSFNEQTMAGSTQLGLNSSRWAVSPAPGPKDEKTMPTSNRAISNNLQAQTKVHDRVTTMTTRRLAPVESAIPKIATHGRHNKLLQEQIPRNANTVSNKVEDQKVQGHNRESEQVPGYQVHNVKVESPSVQPTQAQSAQAQVTQARFRPVRETELFQGST